MSSLLSRKDWLSKPFTPVMKQEGSGGRGLKAITFPSESGRSLPHLSAGKNREGTGDDFATLCVWALSGLFARQTTVDLETPAFVCFDLLDLVEDVRPIVLF